MAGSVTITVSLFGAFREALAEPQLALSLPKGSGLSHLRAALLASLGELVHHSAFADASRILPHDTLFDADAELAILPPVCGG